MSFFFINQEIETLHALIRRMYVRLQYYFHIKMMGIFAWHGFHIKHTRCLKCILGDPVNSTSHVLFLLDRCLLQYGCLVWHKFTLYLIFSSNVCEYLRQCLCNYPETLLRDRKVYQFVEYFMFSSKTKYFKPCLFDSTSSCVYISFRSKELKNCQCQSVCLSLWW